MNSRFPSAISLSIIFIVLLLSVNNTQSQDTKIQQVEYSFGSGIDLRPLLQNNEISPNKTREEPQSLTILIENQDEVNSKLDISIDNQKSNLTTDYELTYNLYFMDQRARETFASLFGILMNRNWNEVRNQVNTLSEDEGLSIDMEKEVGYFFNGQLNSMHFVIETDQSDDELYYEYETGLLLASSHHFDIVDETYGFDIELTKVNGGSTYFDSFYVQETSSDSNSPLGFIWVSLFMGTVLLFVIIKLRNKRNYSNYFQASEKLSTKLSKSDRHMISTDDDTIIMDEQVQYVDIPINPYKIRTCCYQTARLNESYCPCGRVISGEVRALFE